jgi:hypothetical protein
MVDLPSKERMCHHTGFKESCRELVASGKCERWMTITGQLPQEDTVTSHSMCIDDWGPFLMMENSKCQRSTSVAVESFRNEMVQLNRDMNALQGAALALALGQPTQLGEGGKLIAASAVEVDHPEKE